MTRSFERIARRESILKEKFKMFSPKTIYTEHLNFPFCLPAKNNSPKLSQVFMHLQFSGTLLKANTRLEKGPKCSPVSLLVLLCGQCWSSRCESILECCCMALPSTMSASTGCFLEGNEMLSKHQHTLLHTCPCTQGGVVPAT